MSDVHFIKRCCDGAVNQPRLTWSSMWYGLANKQDDNGRKIYAATHRRQERGPSSPPLHLTKAVETTKAPAISRAVAVLRLLADSDVPLGMHTIARQLWMVPSTCHYVLKALLAEELVTCERDTRRYSLRPGVLLPLHTDMLT
jgi:hypothetical protein